MPNFFSLSSKEVATWLDSQNFEYFVIKRPEDFFPVEFEVSEEIFAHLLLRDCLSVIKANKTRYYFNLNQLLFQP